jgi:MerR family transcriptional regulator, copper efflux regulator
MRDTLAHLAQHCHGDARPDCPILEGLAHADDGGADAENHCGRG